MSCPGVLLEAYIRMLPRLMAEEQLAAIQAAQFGGAIGKNHARDTLRQLVDAARIEQAKDGPLEQAIKASAMGFKVVRQKAK